MTKTSTKRKRRLLQFSLRTLLLLTVLIALAFSWPHMYRQYVIRRLSEYAGCDLRELPDDEKRRVHRWIEHLVGWDNTGSFEWWELSGGYWLVHRASPELGSRLYLVEVMPAIGIPGNSHCRVHIRDRWGNPAGTLTFNIGYSVSPQSVAFDQSERDFVCLKIEMYGMWSGETRQFYRITDDHVGLLRSERLDGTFDMGRAAGNGFEVTDKPPDWSQWERLLASSERIDQLRGLAAFWSWDNQEHLQPIDQQTRIRLQELSESQDPWIREESAMALQLIDKGRHAFQSSQPQ